MIERIHWLGHASFRINGLPHEDGGPVVYIDPWRLPPDSPPADLILVSHDHYHHCSPDDISRVRHTSTLVVANPRAAQLLGPGIHALRPWQAVIGAVDGVSLRAVPAYTVNKAYHAKTYEGLGFVLTMQGWEIYFAGDTDAIPEMDMISCDIALLPVGGAFTMSYEEAAEVARCLQPRYAIPMHYGSEIPGSKDDGRRFCKLVNGAVEPVGLPAEDNILLR